MDGRDHVSHLIHAKLFALHHGALSSKLMLVLRAEI